ncbi:unnamed protein product [Heligmosomoides polygyrus]|uniref:SEA domain-containing protein n=1 Tax=Heligmosomoides polygyrus TaxID=6339 RepID=A0A183F6V3_HELPZ|nr:unnamed protein product [Heligmosomoides polygyrus]
MEGSRRSRRHDHKNSGPCDCAGLNAQEKKKKKKKKKKKLISRDIRNFGCVLFVKFGFSPMTSRGDNSAKFARIRAFSAKSAVYLLTIWICGGLFTALVMYLLLLQLKERPHYFGRGTHIGGTPHVVFEPNPNRFDVRTKSVISFRSDDPSTYYNLMVRYKHLLTSKLLQTDG